MKLVKCSNQISHFYDADRYSSCPHCKKINEIRKEEIHMESTISLDDDDGIHSKSEHESDNDMTVELNDNTGPAPKDTLSKQIADIAASGNISDIKTVAYYDFGADEEPVVGWVVAVNTDSKGRSFELKVGKNSIGRTGAGNIVDVDLKNDPSVSRGEQAVLIYEPKKRKFLLQPANGNTLVYHNDELLMNFAELSGYDKITIGETVLVFMPFCSDKFSWDE